MPSTIGIIYPPPEVRSIVDKTASFVARNGPEFEEKIRQNEINNTKFNFLTPNDPYHAYYQHKVKEIQEGKTPEPPSMPPPPPPSIQQQQQQQQQSIQSNLQKMTISAKQQDAQTKIIEQMIILKDPPVDLDYILDAPSIMPLDIDVIKLTAQFVARNGRPFLTSVMNKEQRNPMFDFLKPQHSHFSYFTRLVDQYTKILLPPKDLVDKMQKEIESPFSILKDVAYRVEWEKAQQKEKQKEEEYAEKERVAYAQIDWHDFVVVETVDYQPNEIGNFPPPTTPQDVGARIVAQERFDAGGAESQLIDKWSYFN
jgi:splicing factor 3A subunit 1